MEKSFSERVEEAFGAVKALSPQEASRYKMIYPNTVFVDPRDEADIQSTTGIIPGALNVPLDALSQDTLDQLPEELRSRTRTIIASCQGGPMGALAAHALKKHGYSNVYFIEGGTQSWLDSGYTTAK